MRTYPAIVKGEDSNILSMVDVVPSHDRMGVILHPYPSQDIARNLIVLIDTLSIVSDEETHTFTVTDVTISQSRGCTLTTDTHCCSNCKRFYQTVRSLNVQPTLAAKLI